MLAPFPVLPKVLISGELDQKQRQDSTPHTPGWDAGVPHRNLILSATVSAPLLACM